MPRMTQSEYGKLGAEKANAARKIRLAAQQVQYESSPKQCAFCGNALTYSKKQNKFCNQSCAAKMNNLGVARNTTTFRLCLHCCKPVDSDSRGCCSKECRAAYAWHVRKTEIIAAGACKSKATVKRYLKETKGDCCSLCGTAAWQNQPLVFVLDHIDGNPDNWNLDNLRLLCPNCDSQTPTFKGRNRGNGRHVRRQRYNEGLSY